ncbi:hypothetical protein GCM10009687_00470 [Asanoa iriomotensis]|uniref:Peptidase S8/S53 domain-containing protein n=2 Tax=Asanoa iriomotensis TaxID=234613 RepID=A0ABQ4CC41_9ACTN|nr:hypothetical protein Air01nite_64390 [Asanoa iriomotensis]
MAGIIAAHGRGGTGAIGIAPKAKILPVAASLGTDLGGQDNVALGIAWATANGATVINISGGGNPSPDLRLAVEDALRKNIVVVAAAGNRPMSQVGFPAAYPGVLAVGATDRSGNHADISVTGESIVIAAPGVEIMTTRRRGAYGTGTGTSDAAAIVSGAAALVRSRFPQLTAAEVIRRLTATATDKGQPGHDDQYGYGALNLVAALTDDIPSIAPPNTTIATNAPEPSPQGGRWVAIWGLVAVVVVIAAFAVHVYARRHRGRRGPVA